MLDIGECFAHLFKNSESFNKKMEKYEEDVYCIYSYLIFLDSFNGRCLSIIK